jgi:hypothetical protein
VIINHVLLALSVLALAAAGSRAAATLGATGLTRVVATAPIAATAAGVCSLALGLAGLGADPIALSLAAAAAWLVTRLAVPARARSTGLAAEWSALPTPYRLLLGALAGVLVALAVWVLRNPALAGDGLVYHSPVVATWVAGGDPPALDAVARDAPLEAYPLTTELLATWAAGIARSFVVVSLWNPAMLGLLALAGWSGLRSVEVPRWIAALAVAALATSPLLVSQLNTFTTDVSALAWLVCCAALCAASLRTPGLLACAVLAAGLAIGTKTTAAPLAAVCLIAAAFALRARMRPLAAPLAVAAAAAAVVGGLWYARNLILHGSPLWPFVAAPWGDDLPSLFSLSDERVLWDPSSADGRLDDYWRALYGGAVLLAGGLLAWAMNGARRVIAASAATAFALVVWANAPFTAFPPDAVFDALQAGAVRYLLPGIAAATLALALAAVGRGPAARVAATLLGVAIAANLVGDARLGFVGDFGSEAALAVDPVMPSVAVPVLGAAAGAALAAAIGWGAARRRPEWLGREAASGAAWIAATAVVGALLAVPASGYVKRSAGLPPTPPAAAWLLSQPGFPEDEAPVAIQGRMIGTLAGDELEHDLTLIEDPDCGRLDRAADEGWVILHTTAPPEGLTPEAQGFAQQAEDGRAEEMAAAECLGDREPAYEDGEFAIFAPDGAGAAAD